MTNIIEIKLPDVGEGVTEAEIVNWHVKVGDIVEEDDPIADVMTDKVTVEMPSPVDGTIVEIIGEVGDVVAVGSVVAKLAIEGEVSVEAPKDNATPKSEAPKVTKKPAKAATKTDKSAAPKTAQNKVSKTVSRPAPVDAVKTTPSERTSIMAAPHTRRKAYEMGIPLQFVEPTGKGDRVTMDDLENYAASTQSAEVGGRTNQNKMVVRTAINETKIIGMRRKIAEQMQRSKSRIPHFSYVEEFDLTALEALRTSINADRKEGQPKLTLLPFFMRAVALLQDDYPTINSRFDDENNVLQSYEAVHIGVATQTDIGLVVPVVRNVEARDIWSCAQELTRVTTAAREGTAQLEDMSGSTITLTSLGTLGGISATPVINAPEVAIIGPNKLMERVVVKDGQFVTRTVMNVSSSFDHRIIDGYDAAKFIQSLKKLVETPALLFMEGYS